MHVTLRQKPLRNDRISLYLDYYPAIRNPYTMKMSRREFLGIYIYAKPKNEQQRMFNQDMLNKAEAIRCIRVQSLINEEFGFLDKNKQKVDFLAYFRTKAREKYEKWDCVYNHFEKFVGGKCTFGDVTVELCEKFKDYLLKCKQINHPNAYISRNSAAGYYSTFRALLKIAYKEKMLRENLNDFLEKIEWKEVKKEYLTLDEVKKLAATPCKILVLKQASLFACMTGLRISDILKLEWRDFEVGPDQGYYIRICTEKTETEATHRKDRNRGHPSHQSGSTGVVWRMGHRKSLQRLNSLHDPSPLETMDRRSRNQKAHNLPLLQSLPFILFSGNKQFIRIVLLSR